MKITVIGVGRVGLPLCLVLDHHGHNVEAFDLRPEATDPFVTREVPFEEVGMQVLLDMHSVKPAKSVTKSDAYIITVGTPVNQHFLIDVSALENAVWPLFEAGLMEDSILILRSTIPVEYVDNLVERALVDYNMVLGVDYFLAYCPERIAEGVAIPELHKHPQLIGTKEEYDDSFFRACRVFHWVTQISMTAREAAFAKLATNTYRYMHFAIANYLQMASANHGVDFMAIRDKMQHGYPRLASLPSPGFTGGPCLRKDFSMLGTLGDLAFNSYATNEMYPHWIAKRFLKKGQKVAIIGAGFKDNSDDLRDSLVESLYVAVSNITSIDPVVCDLTLPCWEFYTFSGRNEFVNCDLEYIVNTKVDVVIFGNAHTKFAAEVADSGLLHSGVKIIDPFGYISDLYIDNSLD